MDHYARVNTHSRWVVSVALAAVMSAAGCSTSHPPAAHRAPVKTATASPSPHPSRYYMTLASCQWVTQQAPLITTTLQEVQALPAANARAARMALLGDGQELGHWAAVVLKSGPFSQTVGWSGELGKAGTLVTVVGASPAGKHYAARAVRDLQRVVNGCRQLESFAGP